jgi:hypothetical protein
VPYGSGSALLSRQAAVIDWPSGPSTIHRVGISWAGPAAIAASRRQTSAMISAEAARLSANITAQPTRSTRRGVPGGRQGTRRAPVAAETIGGTTGISQVGEASSSPRACRVAIR